jgi:hypothetical protein
LAEQIQKTQQRPHPLDVLFVAGDMAPGLTVSSLRPAIDVIHGLIFILVVLCEMSPITMYFCLALVGIQMLSQEVSFIFISKIEDHIYAISIFDDTYAMTVIIVLI